MKATPEELPPFEVYEGDAPPQPAKKRAKANGEQRAAPPHGGHSDADSDGPVTRHARPVALEWLDSAPPRRRWLLEADDPETDGHSRRGWLPMGKVGMLAAAGGVGKTIALVQLAAAVATGREWYGLHVATPGRVLLALAEEDAEEVRRRIYAAARMLDLGAEERAMVADRVVVAALAGESVALLERDPAGNPIETNTLYDLRGLLEAGPDWTLVILDPLVRWAGPDAETDSSHATRTVEAIETLTRAPGSPAVLVAHHTTKTSRRENDPTAVAARGSGALVDGVRWCATMVPSTVGNLKTVELAVAKSNYSHIGEPITLVRDAEGALRPLGRHEREQVETEQQSARVRDVEAQILELVRTGHYTSVTGLQGAIGARRQHVHRAIAALLAEGRLVKSSKREPYRVADGADL